MQQTPNQHQLHLQHQVALHQSYAAAAHSHHQATNYIPQMAVSQGFPTAQGGSTYVSVPMNSVIQHRMNAQHQRLAAASSMSPGACAVTAANFYIQTPGPAPTSSQMSGQSSSSGSGGGNTSSSGGNGNNSSCSLAKLQQLTNGLELIPPSCNSTPPAPMNLTPPPSLHPPNTTMTPPPTHQMLQQQSVRHLSSSPTQAQVTLAGYHKYYPSQMNVNQLSSVAASGGSSGSSRSNSTPNIGKIHNYKLAFLRNSK